MKAKLYQKKSERGVALVITLILLSVITFMAVTFLVVSRREGAQVSTLTQESNAKFAADEAGEQAKAMINAQMMTAGNGLGSGLVVSTNYIQPAFHPGPIANSPTNVSYNFSTIANGNEYAEMLNNLWILPRPPVFMATNNSPLSRLDFRFYQDLNRNGVYDTNGAVQEEDASGALVTNIYVGDPEWIGILQHPDQPHSPSNLFVARYCFIALPIGNSLDMNYIHNQAVQDQMSSGVEGGYLRNQGVGSWELNLAGFLNALNTNFWPNFGSRAYTYNHNQPPGTLNTGAAFDDAAALVQYRYSFNNNPPSYNNLSTFNGVYGTFAGVVPKAFGGDGIDGYSIGPVLTTNLYLSYAEAGIDNSTRWSGADNPNAFFTTQDLFGGIPSPAGNRLVSFTNHMFAAGTTYSSLINSTPNSMTNSYDRYTFYRMLSQLSFGSSSETGYPYSMAGNQNYSNAYGNVPRMNLNYANIGTTATNFLPWTPVQFFTNAADRMLRAYFPNPIVYLVGNTTVTQFLSITNIPIYPANFYTPAVHRILQLAANMYDASTNRYFSNTIAGETNIAFPSVFRPLYSRVGSNIFIAGYIEVSTTNDVGVMPSPVDLRRPTDLARFESVVLAAPSKPILNPPNVYGVPYVIGAKQGFPHFNRFTSSPIITIGRRLEIVKPHAGSKVGDAGWGTNVQYTLAISNLFGIDCWNASANPYGRDVTMIASVDYSSAVTVSNNNVLIASATPINVNLGTLTNIFKGGPGFPWQGSPNMSRGLASISAGSFSVPLSVTLTNVTNSVLRWNPSFIQPSFLTGTPLNFDTTPPYFTPQFIFTMTNRVRLMMIDTASKRLIDYVQLGGLGGLPGLDTSNNITADVQYLDATEYATEPQYQFWTTNLTGTKPVAPSGFVHQILASEVQSPLPPNQIWTGIPLPPGTQIPAAIQGFQNFLLNQQGGELLTSYQVPLAAQRTYYVKSSWVVNDPLVHYTTMDLTDATQTNLLTTYVNAGLVSGTNVSDLGALPKQRRYQPWNTTSDLSAMADVRTVNQIGYKDPLVGGIDAWQFPTNKFPNVGWIGRVHRGTPWQTVYLKSYASATNWAAWTGDVIGSNYFALGYPPDAVIGQPTNDWVLMDLFTTSPNENASHGQLSVNQTNLASWAAVLAGVNVLQNVPGGLTSTYIDPTNTYLVPGTGITTNSLQYMVNSINTVRSSLAGGVFTNAGQLLSVPQLTIASPYVTTKGSATNFLSDAVYERIPQQIMSLVRLGTPKYVIFAYGQSLKPAEHSIVQSGAFFGTCTNYQITGEVETRTVVRFDGFPVPGQNLRTASPRAVVEAFNVLPPE